MKINNIKLNSPFFSAPMAGISNSFFRLMARENGASLVYTEMISAVGLLRLNKTTIDKCKLIPKERPVALQLFGANPLIMQKATLITNQMPIDILDLNLGCPAQKIRHQGAGSALLDNPQIALELIQAVVQSSIKPVTIKLRLGLKNNQLDKIIPQIEKLNIAAICLHPRTVQQRFTGKANWTYISWLKSKCSIPIIGNGDIKSGYQAVKMLNETGCDYVMIGRGALGNPWIFKEAKNYLTKQKENNLSPKEKKDSLKKYIKIIVKLEGKKKTLKHLKQFMIWYSKMLPKSITFRKQIGKMKQLKNLVTLIEHYFNFLEKTKS